MRIKTQDPKYDIEVDASSPESARLVNATTGVAIPSDEPLFIFRAKDALAVCGALLPYHMEVARCIGSKPEQHAAVVLDRVREFQRFMMDHPERMKQPDTTPNAALRGDSGFIAGVPLN